MSANSRIAVLVAHRHTMFRQALRVALTSQPGIEVIAEASNGRDAVEMAERLRPDVAVMDAQLPVVSGVEATRLIRQRGDRPRVVLLAVGVDDELVFGLLPAGASCVLGDADVDELLRAVSIAHDGGSYLSPELAGRFVRNYPSFPARTVAAAPPLAQLSKREREVLQLFADGQGNRAIAEKLTVSVRTVEAHRAHIMHKLEIRSGVELIKYAARNGLIELEMAAPTPTPHEFR